MTVSSPSAIWRADSGALAISAAEAAGDPKESAAAKYASACTMMSG
jgi:hypothetical protein